MPRKIGTLQECNHILNFIETRLEYYDIRKISREENGTRYDGFVEQI